MRLPPWEDMHIHKDTYTKPGEKRRTVIMTLLSPRNYKEETRLEYYKEDKKTITEKQYEILHKKIVDYFGPYCGYAQQFLFKMERENYEKKWL